MMLAVVVVVVVVVDLTNHLWIGEQEAGTQAAGLVMVRDRWQGGGLQGACWVLGSNSSNNNRVWEGEAWVVAMGLGHQLKSRCRSLSMQHRRSLPTHPPRRRFYPLRSLSTLARQCMHLPTASLPSSLGAKSLQRQRQSL